MHHLILVLFIIAAQLMKAYKLQLVLQYSKMAVQNGSPNWSPYLNINGFYKLTKAKGLSLLRLQTFKYYYLILLPNTFHF